MAVLVCVLSFYYSDFRSFRSSNLTFFLIEIQILAGLVGKIVILTLQPPTYEIFTMVSRVVLISSGRMMFYGRRKDMLSYFASVEYPCPPFKNPSDYYRKLIFSQTL